MIKLKVDGRHYNITIYHEKPVTTICTINSELGSAIGGFDCPSGKKFDAKQGRRQALEDALGNFTSDVLLRSKIRSAFYFHTRRGW